MTEGRHAGRLVLLADSQLLFPGRYSHELRNLLSAWLSGRTGIYIGAANGDVPEYFQLAQEAFSALGAALTWQKSGQMAKPDTGAFYLLAGGDVAEGWRYISRPDVISVLQRARQENAVFIGVSAGAMHLAHAFLSAEPAPATFLGWVSAAVAVHEEREDWPTLQHYGRLVTETMPVLAERTERLPLITLPTGGALVAAGEQNWQAGKGCGWYRQSAFSQELPWLSSSCLLQMNEHHYP